MSNKQTSFYLLLKKIAKKIYGKWDLQGLSNIPSEPSIIVGNHSQVHGPLVSELLFPYQKTVWCISEVMDAKTIPDYAMRDFFIYKSQKLKWLYKAISRFVAKPLAYIFNNADTLPVYKDNRIISTFKQSILQLENNKHVIIFPEDHTPYNNIINDFQSNYIDLARLYYHKTGRAINFVPMYIAPKLKTVVFGEKIQYNPKMDFKILKQNINDYLKNTITTMAVSLPSHVIVPYANISKREYIKSR